MQILCLHHVPIPLAWMHRWTMLRTLNALFLSFTKFHGIFGFSFTLVFFSSRNTWNVIEKILHDYKCVSIFRIHYNTYGNHAGNGERIRMWAHIYVFTVHATHTREWKFIFLQIQYITHSALLSRSLSLTVEFKFKLAEIFFNKLAHIYHRKFLFTSKIIMNESSLNFYHLG